EAAQLDGRGAERRRRLPALVVAAGVVGGVGGAAVAIGASGHIGLREAAVPGGDVGVHAAGTHRGPHRGVGARRGRCAQRVLPVHEVVAHACKVHHAGFGHARDDAVHAVGVGVAGDVGVAQEGAIVDAVATVAGGIDQPCHARVGVAAGDVQAVVPVALQPDVVHHPVVGVAVEGITGRHARVGRDADARTGELGDEAVAHQRAGAHANARLQQTGRAALAANPEAGDEAV